MVSKAKKGEAVHISGQANEPLSALPHALPIPLLESEIQTDLENGLSSSSAATRLQTHGPNALDDGPGVSAPKILLRQIANAMTLVKRTISPIHKNRFSDPFL